ncbi:MAG: hypothetical protein RSA40_00205 [Malacoplasma sp.]
MIMENKDFFWVEIKKEKIMGNIFDNKRFFIEKFLLDSLKLPTANSAGNIFDENNSFYIVSKNSDNCLEFCSYISRTYSTFLISFFKGNYFIFNNEGKYIYIDSKNNFSYESVMNIFNNFQKNNIKNLRADATAVRMNCDENTDNFIATKLTKYNSLFKSKPTTKIIDLNNNKFNVNNLSVDKHFDINKINYDSFINNKNFLDSISNDEIPHIHLVNCCDIKKDNIEIVENDFFLNASELKETKAPESNIDLRNDFITSWENESLDAIAEFNNTNNFSIYNGNELLNEKDDFPKYSDNIDLKVEDLVESDILKNVFDTEDDSFTNKLYQDIDNEILAESPTVNIENDDKINEQLEIIENNIFLNDDKDEELEVDNSNENLVLENTNKELEVDNSNENLVLENINNENEDIILVDKPYDYINDYDFGKDKDTNVDNDAEIDEQLEIIKNNIFLKDSNDENLDINDLNENVVYSNKSYEDTDTNIENNDQIDEQLSVIKQNMDLDNNNENIDNTSGNMMLNNTPYEYTDANVEDNVETIQDELKNEHTNTDISDEDETPNTDSTNENAIPSDELYQNVENEILVEDMNTNIEHNAEVNEQLEVVENNVFLNDNNNENLEINNSNENIVLDNDADDSYHTPNTIDDDLDTISKNIFDNKVYDSELSASDISENIIQEEKPLNRFDNFLNDLKKEREKLQIERNKFKDKFFHMNKSNE